ncbi:MAG: metallophosphoesterase [Clostridia bacterium]|nr:metallophosphoesterase [Clostridia bacterium]
MDQLIIHEYHLKIKGVKRKVLYQFSDVHLCPADESSTPRDRERAAARTQSWREERLQFATHHGERCDESLRIPAEEHLTNLLQAVTTDGDALVIAGDLFDFVNEAAARVYDEHFADLPVPHLFVCGNHEPKKSIPDGYAMARIKQPVQLLDLGDLIIVGFDDSDRTITPEQLAALRELLAQDKPLIVAMHVPIQVEGNEAHKRCDDYFRLNYPDAPRENLEFIDLICQHADKIAAVLTGHLHFLNTSELAPGLVQFVSSQGILGNLNRFVIGE